MKTIEITFRVKLPVDATEEQIREWVEFELNQNSMHISNPLSKFDLDAQGHIRIWNCP